jgi:hypothetical protein
MYSLLITLYGCGKPSNNPTSPVVNITACTIASDVDQVLGLRNFEYDDKGLLTKVTAPNYYYGPVVKTITSAKVTDTFSGYSGSNSYNGSIYYSYLGGSGNIYDGNPEFVYSSLDSGALYQFKYDAKKRLTSVLIPTTANGYLPNTFFTIFRFELNFTYDANDNVTQIKIVKDYQEKINVPQSGETRIDYLQTSDEELNITYDDKPSPYTAISKYWKFVGVDFRGFWLYNLDRVRFWANCCAILSKNNPKKITGKLTNDIVPPADVIKTLTIINSTLTYQYNEKNFPVTVALDGAGINSFTYNCK